MSTINLNTGEKTVKNHVEPPILLSRIITFALAGALVVLGTLIITLADMFPLNRPQVFFLTTIQRANQDITLTHLHPKDENLDAYKAAFVREYIRNRNEIFSSPVAMHKKWNNVDGEVRKTSTDDIYANFANTYAFQNLMSSAPVGNKICNISFYGSPVNLATSETTKNTYQVKFKYLCEDNTGFTWQKDYTIRIKLIEDNEQIKWIDRIDNPLGLLVSEYTIISGDTDPLDSKINTENTLTTMEGLE